MKNTQNTNKALVEALVYNNRFASVKVDGEQIGVEAFSAWKMLIEKLHRAAYAAYVVCENSGLKAESNSIDKTDIFNAIRSVHIGRTFKMMIKTPVIQIYGSHNSLYIIAYKHLGMNEAWRILINFNA